MRPPPPTSGRPRWLRTLGLAGTVLACSAFYVERNTASILIYHTNDIHGRVLAQSWQRGEAPAGGFGSLAQVLKDSRRKYLLIDSGDFFQGTPEGDLSRGRAALDCMNALAYDALAVGNHDLDFGQETLAALAGAAAFPFLAANVRRAGGDRPDYLLPYVLKDVDGVRIAIVGLITSQAAAVSRKQNVDGLRFEDEGDALRRLMPQLKSQGAQVVVVAAHVGFESGREFAGEKSIAAGVPGIHLILGGHTHFKLNRAYQDPKNKTWIVHNLSGLRTVTKTEMRVWRKDGKIFSFRSRVVPLDPARTGEDPDIVKIGLDYERLYASGLDSAIGSAAADLTRKGPETLLGNWLTDVMRSTAGADIAFQNLGGMRADISSGPITERQIYWAAPFYDTLITMDMTGAQVRRALKENIGNRYGFLQVSGLKAVYRAGSSGRASLLSAEAAGRPLDDRKIYRVVAPGYLAEAGDDFSAFASGANRRDTGIFLRAAAAQFVRSSSPVTARLEGRITLAEE